MTKSEEKIWRNTFDGLARHAWVAFPVALIGVMESIIDSQAYAPGEKIKLMKLAMDAYNEALNETSVNPTDSGRHRTSCPEHTED